jgi:hypothetical protein
MTKGVDILIPTIVYLILFIAPEVFLPCTVDYNARVYVGKHRCFIFLGLSCLVSSQ